MGLLSTIGAASGRAFGLTRVGAAIRDAYFNLTTLLLPGNGTNGAQNNTFLDSSTNNFTITRNGNTTQGTFSPFSQTGWSNYFDGSGDYLSAAYNSAFAFPGDFTIEFWVNWSAHGSSAGFVTNMQSSGGAPAGWQIVFNGANDTVSLEVAGSYPFITSSSTLPKNTWAHVAVVRSGSATNNVKMYFDGVQVAQGTNTSTLDSTNASLFIGCERTGGAFITGYMSNVRIVKGTAVYTSAFTPPTSPLTAITNTQLLTCQSNRFIDNSTNAFTITVNGNPSVQAFSPFAPTAAYSAATVGGSGYFDGSVDMLETPSITIGTNNFCFECWLYPTVAQGATTGIFTANSTNGLQLSYFGTTDLGIAQKGVAFQINGAGIPIVNQWNHVAFVRSGTGTNQTSIFLNGARIANGTVSYSYAASLYQLSTTNAGGTVFQGYIAGARLTNGSTPYDATQSTLTIPTAPPTTSASNTALLLNFTNAGITDATAKNDLETVGNAQISTTQSKFGGSSMYFDGTGDYLLFPSRPLQAFGTGDFTIEFWFNASSIPQFAGIIDMRNPDTSNAGWNVLFYDNKISFGTAAVIYIAGVTTLSTGTWYHYALSRSGNTFKQFLNGTQEGTTYTGSSTQNFTNTILQIGSGASGAYTGYLDDVRITRGYARYTSNFTPPTVAYPLQ